RGAEPSDHVLQVLRTQPVADTNRNFVSERSNLGTAYLETIQNLALLGAGFMGTTGMFNFEIEEYGPEGPLTSSDTGFGLYPDYDPNGLKPAPNSVKVLSHFDSGYETAMIRGANVGCGYDSNFDPMT